MPPQSDLPHPRAFLEILRGRRSRRFGLGMAMESGPMAFRSRHPGLPLTEGEEALLVFAAAGVTGPALGDLVYERGQGGTILAGLNGRTVPSGDAIQTCGLIVLNPEATYYVRRPRDMPAEEVRELVALAESGDPVEAYRRARVRIGDGSGRPPVEPFFNLDCNRWSLYDPAATYLLPVADLTVLYINALLEVFNEENGLYPLDERAWFRPAGVKRFARSRGGHLVDDLRRERALTIQQLEALVGELAAAEMGMMLQNVGLMTQALGLGGFTHWAAHPYGWFQRLGFRMASLPASRYLGLNRVLRLLARLFRRDQPVPYVLGLEAGGEPLLRPHCPPYFGSMEEAVLAVVDSKWGPEGIFRGGADRGAWSDPDGVAGAAPGPSEAAVAATVAYCEYVHGRYGRFPAYRPPLRTLLGFQANHVDVEFYDRFYRPEALTDAQRSHFRDWHGEAPG